MAVVLGQMLAQPARVLTGIDVAQKTTPGHMFFEIKQVEQPLLPALLLPRHFPDDFQDAVTIKPTATMAAPMSRRPQSCLSLNQVSERMLAITIPAFV